MHRGSLCFSNELTSRPFDPCPSHTEKKWQCRSPMICGDVIYASWLTLKGLCDEIPPFVANENLVIMFVILLLGREVCLDYLLFGLRGLT